MPTRYYSNTAFVTSLTAAVDATQTSIAVEAINGYPTLFPYIITIDKNTYGKGEACLVVGVSGNTFTVQRGYDGTTATTHDLGAQVSHDHTAIDYRETQERLDRLEGSVDFTKLFLFGGL